MYPDDRPCFIARSAVLKKKPLMPGCESWCAQCTSQRCAVRGPHELHVCMDCEHTMKVSTPGGDGEAFPIRLGAGCTPESVTTLPPEDAWLSKPNAGRVPSVCGKGASSRAPGTQQWGDLCRGPTACRLQGQYPATTNDNMSAHSYQNDDPCCYQSCGRTLHESDWLQLHSPGVPNSIAYPVHSDTDECI